MSVVPYFYKLRPTIRRNKSLIKARMTDVNISDQRHTVFFEPLRSDMSIRNAGVYYERFTIISTMIRKTYTIPYLT